MMDYRNENLNKGEIEEQLNRRKKAIGLLKDPKTEQTLMKYEKGKIK